MVDVSINSNEGFEENQMSELNPGQNETMEKFLEQVEANEESEGRDTLDAQEGNNAGEVGNLPGSNAGDRRQMRRGTGYIAAANLEEGLRGSGSRQEESKQLEHPVIEKKNKRDFVTEMPVSQGPTTVQLANGQNYILKSCMRQRSLKNAPVPEQEKRVDKRGNEIFAGNQKKYKVTYVDQINKSEPLLQVTMVESYKKYNTDQSQADTPCCTIF